MEKEEIPVNELKEQVDEALQHLRSMDTNLGKLDKRIETMNTMLTGDGMNPANQGLIGTVNRNRDDIDKLIKWKDKITWIIVGATAVATAISSTIMTIAMKLILK